MCDLLSLLVGVVVLVLLEFPPARANWPIFKYKNGTVGVKNEGGEVHVNSDVFSIVGGKSFMINGTNILHRVNMIEYVLKLSSNVDESGRWYCQGPRARYWRLRLKRNYVAYWYVKEIQFFSDISKFDSKQETCRTRSKG